MKIDIYISRNSAALHLGHAEIFLRELLERETAIQDASFKTPVIQKTVRIFGSKGGVETPLGSLRFKMRMRKPVSEAVRYFREKNEIENMKAFDQTLGTTVIGNRRKLITI
jgi:hypothetical protein